LDAATLIPSQKTIESLLNFSKSKKIERLIPRLSKVIDELNEAAPEPMRYVYLSSFASTNKSRYSNDDAEDAMELRPLTFVPESNATETNDELEELNQKSVFDQSILVDLDMNTVTSDESAPINKGSTDVAKENEVSYGFEIAKLEEGLLGNKSNLVMPEVTSDVTNPFKSDKQHLKRKLDTSDAQTKKKKM
jgi:hypothetical protein